MIHLDHEPGQFWTLPGQVQEAVHREVARIKGQFAIEAEVLYLEDVARIMGVPVKSLWNLRGRDAMPPIPVLRIGQKDGYWINHVAMWLMGVRIHEMSPAPLETLPVGSFAVAAADSSKNGAGKGDATSSKTASAKSPKPRREAGASTQALLAKANQLFDEMEKKRDGRR